MIEAYSSSWHIDECAPHAHLRTGNDLRGQSARSTPRPPHRDAYLKLAGDLEGFLTRCSTAAAATVEDRQRSCGPRQGLLHLPGEKSHTTRIHTRQAAPAARQRDSRPTGGVTMRADYLLPLGA